MIMKSPQESWRDATLHVTLLLDSLSVGWHLRSASVGAVNSVIYTNWYNQKFCTLLSGMLMNCWFAVKEKEQQSGLIHHKSIVLGDHHHHTRETTEVYTVTIHIYPYTTMADHFLPYL